MRLAWDNDTRTCAAGAAVALACGLLLGGAMRPDLGDDGRPAGPQMIAGWSAQRSTGPFDPGATYASYSASGQVPDYVIGTDWKRTMAWPDEHAAVSPPARARAQDDQDDDAVVAEKVSTDAAPEAAPPLTPAAFDMPAKPVRYPSQGGGLAPTGPADADTPAAATG